MHRHCTATNINFLRTAPIHTNWVLAFQGGIDSITLFESLTLISIHMCFCKICCWFVSSYHDRLSEGTIFRYKNSCHVILFVMHVSRFPYSSYTRFITISAVMVTALLCSSSLTPWKQVFLVWTSQSITATSNIIPEQRYSILKYFILVSSKACWGSKCAMHQRRPSSSVLSSLPR